MESEVQAAGVQLKGKQSGLTTKPAVCCNNSKTTSLLYLMQFVNNQVIKRENQPYMICITRMKNEVEGCVTYVSGLVGGGIPTSTIMEKTNRVGIASIDL